jgi:hypothetical protein
MLPGRAGTPARLATQPPRPLLPGSQRPLQIWPRSRPHHAGHPALGCKSRPVEALAASVPNMVGGSFAKLEAPQLGAQQRQQYACQNKNAPRRQRSAPAALAQFASGMLSSV